MKCLESVSVRSMNSLHSVEECMKNINEKENFKHVRTATDVFWTNFTEHLRKVREACMNIQNH